MSRDFVRILPTSALDEIQLRTEWQQCCGTPAARIKERWNPACAIGGGSSICFAQVLYGLDIQIANFTVTNVSMNVTGRTFLLDTYVKDWYQFGHATSKFAQLWSINERFDNIVMNRNSYWPGNRKGHYSGEEHIGVIFNVTVRDPAAVTNTPIILTPSGGFLCVTKFWHAIDPEKMFFSFADGMRWRGLLADKFGIESQQCPPPRAAILQRYEGTSLRGFTNELLIDSVAAEFGIKHVHRVRIGSMNNTRQHTELFSSIGLLFTTHTSQTKNLIFSRPNTAVVELTARFLHGRISGQSEGLDFLNITYISSKYHNVNVTGDRCDRPDIADVHCRLTLNATLLRESIASALAIQRRSCPWLMYG